MVAIDPGNRVTGLIGASLGSPVHLRVHTFEEGIERLFTERGESEHRLHRPCVLPSAFRLLLLFHQTLDRCCCCC